MLSGVFDLLEHVSLRILDILMDGLGKAVDLVADLLMLNQVHEVLFNVVHRFLELRSDIMERYHLVGLHVLLEGFQPDVLENLFVFMLSEKGVVLQLFAD